MNCPPKGSPRAFGIWDRTFETLSFGESLTIKATFAHPAWLWAGLLATLSAAVGSVALLAINPENWPAGVLAAVFFGPGTLVYSRMLITAQRQRTAADR